MAAKGPNVHQFVDDAELSDSQRKIAKKRRSEAVRTPDDALDEYKKIETETLENILGKSDDLGARLKRVGKAFIPGMVGGGPFQKGRIVAAIREEGDKLAKDPGSDINQKLALFKPEALKHLRLISLKNVDKFKRATMRTREALRVKNGVNFMRNRWSTQLQRLRELTGALREVQGKTIKGHFPDFLSPEARSISKAERKTEELMKTATEASQQVISEEQTTMRNYEEFMRQRYAGERKMEDKLRQMMADYLPDRLKDLNDALLKVAQGDNQPLIDLKNELIAETSSDDHYLPSEMRKAFELAFDQMVGALSSDNGEYARYKATEMVADQAKEMLRLDPGAVLSILKSKPIGTQVKVAIKDVPSQTKTFTVIEKSSSELTLLPDTPNEEGEVIFVDFRKKAILAPNYNKPKRETVQIPDPADPKKTKKEARQRIVTEEFKLADEGVVIALAS